MMFFVKFSGGPMNQIFLGRNANKEQSKQKALLWMFGFGQEWNRKASLAADVSRLGHSSSPSHKYTPRRAVLYVPGNDEKKIRKIPALNVDCAVLDCEDGVAVNKKLKGSYTENLKVAAFG
ncbi:hypothetical protein CB1_060782086 [Camelus ferus]|nr:hypothetical protein CB1_060782086 [Camelus ferus]